MSTQLLTYLFVGATFSLYIGIALWSRAQSTNDFYVAGKGVHPVANGMATAADWMSAASFLSMAGLIAFLGKDGSVYLMGWTGGYVLLALLLAPYLRKFGKFTVPDFIGERYYSKTARKLAVLCLIFISFTYIAGQMRGVGIVFSRFLEVDINTGVIVGMAIVFFYAVLGGMKGIAYTQVAQYCVLIFAYLVPAIFISILMTGEVIPQIGFGSTLVDSQVYLLDKLDQVTKDLGFVDEDLSEHDLVTILRHYDEDGDGQISYAEFCDALTAAPIAFRNEVDENHLEKVERKLYNELHSKSHDEIREAFKEMDEHGDGHITMDEFHRFLDHHNIQVSEEETAAIMLHYDKDVKGSQVMSSTGTGGLGIDTPTMAPPVLGVFNALLKRAPYNFPVQSRSDSFTTTSFKAMYDLNDNVKLYGSYAEGYKAGGFDGSENAPKVASTTPGVPSSTPGAEFQFEPEEAETIEVGAKLDFPSRSLRASIAYFTTDYKDLQTSTFDGSGFVVTNAASAEIDGVEFDFTWAPTDNLVIGGSVTSLDFAYLEFTNAGCTAPQDVAYRIATGVKDGCEQDLTGRTGDYAPEMSSSLYVNYYQTLSNDRTLKLSVSGNSVGEYYSSGDLDPNGIHDNATKIDARALITNSNGFEVSLYAKNLTDRITAHQIFDLPLVPGSYFSMWSPGREVGLTLSAKF